jgi:hypothetical protein
MNDYVPYEERLRRSRQSEQDSTSASLSSHQSSTQRVSNRIASLGGLGTNVYLEILKPAKGLAKLFGNKTTISKPGMRGGPDFVISEVLDAYRIRRAIVYRGHPDAAETTFDAFVVPDGRVWRFNGAGETTNTYQMLASSAERLSALPTNTLERILIGLPASP